MRSTAGVEEMETVLREDERFVLQMREYERERERERGLVGIF